jgi:hypothetical protein
MDPRAIVNVVQDRTIVHPWPESNPERPAHKPSLCRVRYPGFYYVSMRSRTANYGVIRFRTGCFLKKIALRYVTSRSRRLFFYVCKDMTWNIGCKVWIMKESDEWRTKISKITF